jgi:hypothetical protein
MTRAALLILLLAGCADCGGGGEPCGAGDAGATGLTVTVDAVTLEFGNFTSSANNDCSVAGSPTSVTIDGEQTDPAQPSFFLTLCLPRPDQISGDLVPLVPSAIPPGDDDRVQVINVNGNLGGGCLVTLDSAGTFDATAEFGGFCGDGVDPAGYAMALAGTLPGTRICPGPVQDDVAIELGGVVAVSGP